MFFVLFRYIPFVPKMLLYGMFLVFLKYLEHNIAVPLTYKMKVYFWYVTLVCLRYVTDIF